MRLVVWVVRICAAVTFAALFVGGLKFILAPNWFDTDAIGWSPDQYTASAIAIIMGILGPGLFFALVTWVLSLIVLAREGTRGKLAFAVGGPLLLAGVFVVYLAFFPPATALLPTTHDDYFAWMNKIALGCILLSPGMLVLAFLPFNAWRKSQMQLVMQLVVWVRGCAAVTFAALFVGGPLFILTTDFGGCMDNCPGDALDAASVILGPGLFFALVTWVLSLLVLARVDARGKLAFAVGGPLLLAAVFVMYLAFVPPATGLLPTTLAEYKDWGPKVGVAGFVLSLGVLMLDFFPFSAWRSAKRS
jgi:hypothetical protein